MKLYHGTRSNPFEKFDSSFCGKGTDDRGADYDDFMLVCKLGFGFTTDYDVAYDTYGANVAVIEGENMEFDSNWCYCDVVRYCGEIGVQNFIEEEKEL